MKRKEVVTEPHSDSGSSDNLEDIINIDFDFQSLKEIDFHGIKTLLRQSFGDDAECIELSGLADRLIQQDSVGTAVKVDEEDHDPYALVSVINLTANKEQSDVQSLTRYLLEKSRKHSKEHDKFTRLLSSDKQLGIVMNDRLINMPPQIAPPMFRMLLEELKMAVDKVCSSFYNLQNVPVTKLL